MGFVSHGVNFAGKFRFKRFHLQIHHHEAAQPQMIKKEVEKKFFAGDFQRVLPADEREADAKFHEEFLDVIKQAQLEVALPGAGVIVRKSKMYGSFSV